LDSEASISGDDGDSIFTVIGAIYNIICGVIFNIIDIGDIYRWIL